MATTKREREKRVFRSNRKVHYNLINFFLFGLAAPQRTLCVCNRQRNNKAEKVEDKNKIL